MDTLLGRALVVATFTLSAPVWAIGDGDFTIIPSIGVQAKNLEFKQELLIDDVEEVGKFDADIPTYTLGLTFGYKRFYLAFKYEDTLEPAVASSDVPFTNPDNVFYLEHGPSDINVERRDFNVTFGGNVWRGLGVFVGYMDGRTKVEPVPVAVNFVFNTDDVSLLRPEALDTCLDPVLFFRCRDTNLAQDAVDGGGSTYRQTYTEDGFYLGASYAWQIADAGTLAISAAFAALDSTYKDNFFPDNGTDFRYEGDAEGVSLSIGWTAQLTDTVGYFVDLRRQRYDMDGDDKSGNFPNSEVSTEETISGLTAGLRWVF